MNRTRGITQLEIITVAATAFVLVTVGIPNWTDAELRAQLTQTAVDMKMVDVALHAMANDYPGGVESGNWGCKENLWIWDCDLIGVSRGVGTYIGWIMIFFGEDDPGVTVVGRILTTPIPYLEEIPIDAFNSAVGSTGSWPTFGYPASLQTYLCLERSMQLEPPGKIPGAYFGADSIQLSNRLFGFTYRVPDRA